jgi:hypothetical protein
MVKSVPMRDGKIVQKPKRKSNIGAVLLFFTLIGTSIGGGGAGVLVPAQLAFGQEQLLGLLNGGIAATDERTFVDACARVPGFATPQAVTRTVRTTYFRNGTALTVTFDGRPTPTITECR